MKLSDVAKLISDRIDSYCVKAYSQAFRNHLGASSIGNDCYRALQYTFRWVSTDFKQARVYRLLNHGNRTEERFEEWLNGAGYKIETHDENGKQFKCSALKGHFGGSCDGKIIVPEISTNCPQLLEFKTNGTGAGFNNLRKDSLETSKPEHWAQVCTYGYHIGFDNVVYLNLNKNDDDLFITVEALNKDYGKALTDKAEVVIFADEPLPKSYKSSTHFKCKFCNFTDICHEGVAPLKNCRSCKHSKPAENATWICGHYDNLTIPQDFIREGCPEWKSFF